MNDRIYNAVCWIGFFPSAVIAAFLVFVIVQMGYQGAYFWAFLVPIHESYSSSSWSPVFVWKLVREIVANLALGATFVWTGAKIVPSGKKIAAFLMALVLIAISAYSILFGREIVLMGWGISGGEITEPTIILGLSFGPVIISIGGILTAWEIYRK